MYIKKYERMNLMKDSLELWGTDFTMQPISYKITELAEGFVDNGESGGAWCLNKHICLRPSFQRNAVWNEDQNKINYYQCK